MSLSERFSYWQVFLTLRGPSINYSFVIRVAASMTSLAMALHHAGHSPIVSLFRTIRLRVRGAIMRGLLYDGALAVACLSALFVVSAHGHPGSGIVVDQKGQVFFQDIVGGAIWKIDERGKLSKYADVKGGH